MGRDIRSRIAIAVFAVTGIGIAILSGFIRHAPEQFANCRNGKAGMTRETLFDVNCLILTERMAE
ncbi:MAG: hypothetical protein KGK16_11480 [Bradyrhizobium sp.]|nr:hypothetical protein [Bradyrhizobium sp.]